MVIYNYILKYEINYNSRECKVCAIIMRTIIIKGILLHMTVFIIF